MIIGAAATRERQCRDCTAGHDHCHDTLIVHTSEWVECAGSAECDARTDRHTFVEYCSELRPACSC